MIDYTAEDFTELPRGYDVVFDAVGKSSYTRCRKLLKPGGLYLTTVPSVPIFLQMLWTPLFGKTRAGIMFAGLRKPSAMARDVEYIGGLAEAGRFLPVIDKSYTLAEAVSAHAHVETGHKKGSVVISLTPTL